MFSSIPIDWSKKFATPTLTPITPKSVYRPHNHILKSHFSVKALLTKVSTGHAQHGCNWVWWVSLYSPIVSPRLLFEFVAVRFASSGERRAALHHSGENSSKLLNKKPPNESDVCAAGCWRSFRVPFFRVNKHTRNKNC